MTVVATRDERRHDYQIYIIKIMVGCPSLPKNSPGIGSEVDIQSEAENVCCSEERGQLASRQAGSARLLLPFIWHASLCNSNRFTLMTRVCSCWREKVGWGSIGSAGHGCSRQAATICICSLSHTNPAVCGLVAVGGQGIFSGGGYPIQLFQDNYEGI